MEQIKQQKDSIYTCRLKEHFPFFGIGSLLYALFYTFCLYRNASGITYPFFVAGTLCYFFFSMQKLGVPYKKGSIFYVVSILLLGISNCLTNSPQLLLMNKCGIFLLSFVLMIHTVYMDQSWNLPKYFAAIAQTAASVLISIFRPVSDMMFYFDAQKQEESDKKRYFLPVFIGFIITIPLLLFMTLLLASADVVFSSMIRRIFQSFNFVILFRIIIMISVVFFVSYGLYAAFCMKEVKEEVKDYRTFDALTAIIVTTALSMLYAVFSSIQILYLFIGKMKLPEGYTYSEYAREGFFQLLAVCILNLFIVLVCLYLFRENTILKIILTVISGCTFIMILSSALRMIMYIRRYNLTFLRIFVLWSLAVIFLLMAGVTVFIYLNEFPLFKYVVTVITLFYIVLSFSHPDYWIARYNLNPAHADYLDDYDIIDSRTYLNRLSTDAAPVLLDKGKNMYISESILDSFASGAYEHELYDYSDEGTNNAAQYKWIYDYYCKIKNKSKEMHIRNFNFSVYTAGKYLP